MSAHNTNTFDVLIEISKGSRNKYEYDFDLKRIRFDRLLYSPMSYPAEYGFIPETLADDGDPLDVLVLSECPMVPMCIVEVKPIALFHMSDEKGADEKVICVPVTDPIWSKLNNLSDINEHQVKEIQHFFQVYKDLENKTVEVRGWGDVNQAIEIINKCRARYKESTAAKTSHFAITA